MTGPLIFVRRVSNPLNKKWEFETNQGYIADAFLQILELFHIDPEDIYIPSFMDMSQIEFRTTKAKRQQISYVFSYYISKLNIGLWDEQWSKDHAQSVTELEGGDWYAIY